MKIPYINSEVFYLVQQTNTLPLDEASPLIAKEDVTVTKCRSCIIPNNFIGHVLSVYDGKKFKRIKIKEEMVGFRLGEFVYTKKLGSSIHNSERNKKKIEKMRRKITQRKIRRPSNLKKGQKKPAKTAPKKNKK